MVLGVGTLASLDSIGCGRFDYLDHSYPCFDQGSYQLIQLIYIPPCIEPRVAFIAIRAYAAYSYLYYQLDESLITDDEYDGLCKWLLANYSWVKPHDINNYLDEGRLQAGTGYDLTIVGQTKDYAESLLKQDREKQNDQNNSSTISGGEPSSRSP